MTIEGGIQHEALKSRVLAERFDNLYGLACWLRSARLYIGNDSGITHLSAAVGTPVIALFAPTDPAIWAPRGEHVSVVATRRPGEAMEAISVDEVLRRSTRCFGRSGKA